MTPKPVAKGLDYHQPTRDSLAGIYLEVSDSGAENPAAEWNADRLATVVPGEMEKLFGLTLTVDDVNTKERPNQPSN